MRLALVLVALLLAGCAGEPPTAPDALNQSTDSAVLPAVNLSSVVVPVWRVGDAWLVDSYSGDEHTAGTLAVSAADASSYSIVTTIDSTATFDAAFDVSYVGKIRADNLAGAQKENTIKFFDFPLEDGKSWSTTWDQTTVNLTATFSPKISTPLGPQPGFLIVGEARGATYVEYDFVPALNWWSRLAFADNYGFTVTGIAHNWTGEYKVGVSKTLLTLGTAAPIGTTPVGSFTVDEGQSVVLLALSSHSERFARAFILIDPANQPYATNRISNFENSAEPSREFTTETLPPTAGEWRVIAPTIHDPSASFTLNVQQIAIETRTL